ncbi:hypothetical protein [Streptomyces sp. NPDC088725]|uniref:hypothetical protein n=1 Tax=Streptomyces sp. NPDC088725 TaxID=3365873 RepID=UPI003802EF50
MSRSEARRSLARLTEKFGRNGVLIVPKDAPGADGADLVPGSALRWPPCECGSEKCPDAKQAPDPGSGPKPQSAPAPDPDPKPQSAAEALSARLAERNRLSRQDRL